MAIDRRALILTAAAAGLVAAATPALAIVPVGPDDMTLGNANAPVTVIEYASASCPHCAHWAREDFPEFRRRFIDTGQVRFVLREILTAPGEFAAAGFLLARCGGRARYFDILDAVFAAQEEIISSGNMADGLAAIAAQFGIPRARFEACVTDEAALRALDARVTRWSEEDGVESTPTFIVGDQRLVGNQSVDELAAAIARARRGSSAAGGK